MCIAEQTAKFMRMRACPSGGPHKWARASITTRQDSTFVTCMNDGCDESGFFLGNEHDAKVLPHAPSQETNPYAW